jgi:hypothetical protein
MTRTSDARAVTGDVMRLLAGRDSRGSAVSTWYGDHQASGDVTPREMAR